MKKFKLRTSSEDETFQLGFRFAELVNSSPGLVKNFILTGDLGCGKTIFVKGFLSSFEFLKSEVTSPTFIILKRFETADRNIYHIDLYRLNSPGEIEGIGIYDFLEEDNAISLIEWGEKLNYNSDNSVKVVFNWIDEELRDITVEAENDIFKIIEKRLST
ncbi:tRNA (adenosine(37)-N6)-threonylcarbamoyltransferase complex ATPase subunit type 1 TsaE [Candidatus Dependentiae bacterium]|nr:tRNA (adenosine(37)-N6)-threonylcarbamoyltransferase complex ATPase subunit type 1 TsaE [Candidatus Dependentiae bacterium]